MIREIGRFEADLSENMWHLAQKIQRFSVGFLQVNPQRVQLHNRIVGEATISFGGGDFVSATDGILAN